MKSLLQKIMDCPKSSGVRAVLILGVRMTQEAVDSISNPIRTLAFVLLGHFGVVIWHLFLLIRVRPGTPRIAVVALVGINLLPFASLIVFAKGFCKLAGSLVIVPLGTALLIGAYTHFLSAGADNVLHMTATNLTPQFQVSAVLLILLEAAACWLGLGILQIQKPVSI